jgi:hypothetical protein
MDPDKTKSSFGQKWDLKGTPTLDNAFPRSWDILLDPKSYFL